MKNEYQNDNEEQPAAEISKNDLQHFCKKIEVTATSLVFKTATVIGDRAHEWENANLSWSWLIAYLLAIVDTDEFDQMMGVAEVKSGAFNPDMHALVALRRKRHPEPGVGADLTDHLGDYHGT